MRTSANIQSSFLYVATIGAEYRLAPIGEAGAVHTASLLSYIQPTLIACMTCLLSFEFLSPLLHFWEPISKSPHRKKVKGPFKR